MRTGAAAARPVGRRWPVLVVLLVLLPLIVPPGTHPPASVAAAPDRPVGPDAFLTGPDAADPLVIARRFLADQRVSLGLTAADVADLEVTDRFVSAHNGVTHLYLRQRWAGIPVFNGVLNLNLTRDGRIINYGNRLVPDLARVVNTTVPALTPSAALRALATEQGLTASGPIAQHPASAADHGALRLDAPGISLDPVPVRLMYQPLDGGSVRLAWDLVIRLPSGRAWLDARVDAVTGIVLDQNDWMDDGEPVQSSGAATPMPVRAADHFIQRRPALARQAPDAYRVFPLPAENPVDGASTLIKNPADALASPFGWHDTNGSAGAEYTITRGNNIHAYQDSGAINGSSGDEPDGGAGLSFDFPVNLAQEPLSYRAGATVNVFYTVNVLHDLLYRYGFDEAAGNFQLNTYGHAGAGGDAVQAEAQDGSGVANANFATPPDGIAPRMQVFLGNRPAYAHGNAPAVVQRDFSVATATFGPQTFAITAGVVLVNDGVGTLSDSCQTPFVNAAQVAGKIALIDRGTCTATTKVANAQANGAIGVLVANTTPGIAAGLTGTNAAIAIPSLAISLPDGTTLKAQLGNGLTMTLVRGGPQRDGALDNGVMVHEYGHGLSQRLTGGPRNVNCLAMPESPNEGWSDLLALMLTATASDTRTTRRTIGTWLIGQTAAGDGVRMFPYTTDMTVNPFTYDSIKATPEPHAVGSVWTSIVWEVYWNLVDDHGFSATLAPGPDGNTLMLQLIVDGLAMQACNPTFIDARDAILAADLVDTGGANQCRIWEGFAKRGLGYGASAGPSYVVSDGTQSFGMPPLCTFQATPVIRDVCAPAATTYTVAAGAYFGDPAATVSVAGVPTGYAGALSTNPVAAPGSSVLTLSATGPIVAGSYPLTVTGVGATMTATATVLLNLASVPPGVVTLTAPVNGTTNQTLQPTLAWQAPTPGLVSTVEVAQDNGFASLVYTATVRTTSLTLPVSLRSGQPYFWRVRGANACGSGPVSATFGFTVRVTPAILLVDDDLGDGTDVGVIAALDAVGQPYDVVTISALNSGPEVDTPLLNNYRTVIWHGGTTGFPSQFSDAALETFLDQGGCLWISAQELFARRNLVPLLQTYLGLANAINDADPADQTTVTGEADPYLSMGTATLAFPTGNYADVLLPDGTATVAWQGNAGGAALSKVTPTYRTTYWGFPFAALPTAALREEATRRTLDWCALATASQRQHLALVVK